MSAATDEPLGRPVPVVEPWSTAYWNGAREHRLVLTRCDSCRRYVHPPQPLCSFCQHDCLSPEQVSGRGRVYGFSIMHLTGVPGFEPPYAVAVVELDEQLGLLAVGNIVDCPHEDIAVGMPVEVTFETLPDGVTLPQWRPVGECA